MIYVEVLAFIQSECAKELRKKADYQSVWVKKNPDKKRINDSTSHYRHRESRNKKMREYGAQHKVEATVRSARHYLVNRQKMIDNSVKWGRDNREHRNSYLRKWTKEKSETDLNFKIGKNIRVRVWWALQAKAVKSARTLELLGCSLPEFRAHIEKQFRPGMSWSNHGLWHLDHIRPCASFDLTNPTQQRQCFNFSNQQPLWKKDNLRKGAKI